ncbi:cerebellar degeneration-related protein 2-like [Diadema antillarum]|uniref:cerebellar degeneration-related protein 2-like n=1 Tax=Diadema antillarum TaxID=105358 RepID=UPI003A8667B7
MFARSKMPFGMDDYTMVEEEDAPDGWYENDLHLAAELGKTLLERNKELEASLLESQQHNEEQAMQIVYLEKQLHVLRDVTESKAQIYEQLDLNSQELEKENTQLKHDLKTAQQRILKINESIDHLESQVHEQQSVIDQLRAAEKERLREGRRQQRAHEALNLNNWGGLPLRRAHSFDLGKPSAESLYEDEITNLQLSIRNLKHDITLKEQRENELESEMAVLVRENKALENHNRELQVKSRMEEIKRDFHSLDNVNEAVCKYCDSMINLADEDKVTEQEKASPKQDGELRRHGSLELKPIAEELHPETKCPLPNHDLINPKSDGVSLLGEIDAQYHNLMDKYNTLLTRSRSTSFHESGGRSRTNSLRRKTADGQDATPGLSKSSSMGKLSTSPVTSSASNQESACPVDVHFESGPPEYKILFKKIYEVLHRPLKLHQKNKKPPGDDKNQ